MSSRSQLQVQVQGEIPRWLQVLRVLGVLGIVTGVALMFAVFPLGVTVATLSGLHVLITEFYVWRKQQNRVWVTDRGTGLTIVDNMGPRDYDDADVISVNLVSHEKFSEGTLKAVRREFTATIEGESRPVVMVNTIKVGQGDPLAGMIERLVNDYRERASEALKMGARVEGQRWSFGADELVAEQKNGPLVVRLDELGAIDVIDGEVNVWKHGEELAFLKVPVHSKNAFLLQIILPDYVVERPEDPTTQKGMGRVLFERKSSRVFRWLALVIGVILFPFALAGFVAGFAAGDPGGFVVGVCVMTVSVGCIWAFRRMKTTVFRCHERGVYRKSLFSERQLDYADVQQFTYSAIRQYYNGVYTGTTLSIAFLPFPERGVKKITFNRSVNTADQALESLREQVSQIIAVRMGDELAAQGNVKWTDNLFFEKEGLRYRPPALIGRKEFKLLPYKQIANFDVQDGTMHIWEIGTKKSVARESTASANFFPGFYLFASLFTSGEELQPEPTPS